MAWTLAELAGLLGAELRGNPDKVVHGPVPAGSSDPRGVTFAESEKYFEKVCSSGVGAAIVGADPPDLGIDLLVVENPRIAFFQLLHMCDKPAALPEGVHPTAIIDPTAVIHPTARIGAFVVVEQEAQICAGALIFPNCYIGSRSTVGEQTRLMPGTVLVQDVTIGARCLIHSGAVLGTDGFGFVFDGSKQVKIPQVGGVTIADDVEIGANTTIDRATSGETTVNEGAKIDNLVQIGHNTSVGDHSVLAAHVGISGSVTIGKRVLAGGQVGIADHVTVGDDVQFAGRTGIFQDVEEPGNYFGTPPTPIKQAMRILSLQQKLPELLKRVRDLEREIEGLKIGD